MAHTIPFDTHAYVKKLRAAGMPEAQAEVQAEAFAELINDQLATKRDLAELELVLRKDIEQLESRLKNDLAQLERRLKSEFELAMLQMKNEIKQLELRITLKLGALVVAALAALKALDKFF